MKVSNKTSIAIKKYGIKTCIDAYALNTQGEGASTVSHSIPELKGNTRSADAAINAGRELAGK